MTPAGERQGAAVGLAGGLKIGYDLLLYRAFAGSQCGVAAKR